jgi:hypothetical protein
MRVVSILVLALLASTPATAQEREWSLDTNNDSEVFMTYGVPQTDDVGVSLWCKIGSGKLRLFVPKSGWPQKKSPKRLKIKVKAGSVTQNLQAKLETDVASNSLSIEAEMKLKDPIVQAMTTSQHLDINTGRKMVIVPMFNAEMESLLKICAGKT